MENPVNQEDTETNTKDAVKAEEPAASNSGDRSDGTSSPPPNCSICLGKLINTSFTDSCLHQFCFTCLLQWSRIKTECPLCKQTFKSIIHNVRSEEDYDQYHVPREAHLSTQATGSFGVTLGLGNASLNAYQRFAYRTTMTPSRRYGRLFASLHPNSNHHTRQGPPVSTSQLPAPSSQERRQRRNVYRTGEWSDPVPEVYSRFRQCSAEYYRRYPHEIDRLIPWINRDLQTIFNSNQPHIAYVLSVITDMLTQYDMRSPEFRNAIRNYFGLETEHFIHELMNYASTDLSMAAYDETVTYFNSFSSPGLMSGGYWTHVQSQTSSSTSSSTISDDSDIRVVDHVDPSGSELPSVGPHLINMPGPSTVSQVFQIQTPEARPFVLTITSSSSESECEIVGYVKPRCERTPEIIELMSSGEEEIVAACNNSLPEIESPRSSSLSPINDQPSTSESSRRLNSKSKANSRQLSLVSRLSDTSSGSDSEIDDTQTNKPTNRRNSKHSTKRSTRKSSPKKNDSVTKKRNKHSYSSSDSNSPRESKCRRTSLNSSRKTKACISSSESDGENQSSSRNSDEFKTTDKDENSKTTCRVRVRKDLINGSKKKHKRRNKRTSSTSSISSTSSSSSSSSESETSNTSLDTSSTSLTNSSSYTSKVNKSRKKKRSKSKRSSKHKNFSDNLHGRHHNRSRSRSRTRSKSRSISRSRSREILSDDINERFYSVNEKYRERKAAKIANKKLKNKHLYAMTDSQNDTEEAYRSNSQCSSVSDRHKTSKSNDNKKYSKSDSNSKTKSHKNKSHKKSSKNLKKQKRSKTRGENNEKRSRRRITSSSSSSSLSSSSSKY